MGYPSYYDKIEPIKLYDPLAKFLGAIEDGAVEINYLDCVKLAGHSCPTVAGAYLMTQAGLDALYQDSLPERSRIKVDISKSKDEGVTGVTANIAAYITGAGDEGGFKGIAGKFARNDLLNFGVKFDGDMRLTRLDTGLSVTISYNPSLVPADKEMKPLMQKLLQSNSTQAEQDRFANMWQERTEKILLHTKKEDIITITKENL